VGRCENELEDDQAVVLDRMSGTEMSPNAANSAASLATIRVAAVEGLGSQRLVLHGVLTEQGRVRLNVFVDDRADEPLYNRGVRVTRARNTIGSQRRSCDILA
jgi:uncharacterized protein (DUF2141 family)